MLTNAEVLAPEPLGRKNVLILAGKVAWIGSEDLDLPAALAPRIVDLSGKTLIPGLIDCHVHFTGGGGEDGFRSRVPGLFLGQFTRSGTTTAVGVLGTDDTTRGTASLLAATRGLREEGLEALCLTGGYHVPPVTLTGSVRGDIVHIDPVIGVGEIALSDHRSSQPTLEEILRLASDAHLAGLLTKKAGIAHFHLGDGERGLELIREAVTTSEIPPRVFHPTHVNRRKALFEEAMALAEQGCNVDVTAFPVREDEDAYSAAEAVSLFLERRLPLGRLTVSSDAGGSLPVFNRKGEMESMGVGSPGALVLTLRELRKQGHALHDVLPVFTSNVADLLRLPDKGRIRVGGDADLVALNPEVEVADVLMGGRFFVRDERILVPGTFEAIEEGSTAS